MLAIWQILQRISKIWNAKLNINDEIYTKKKLIELSKNCDGILCSVEDKIDTKTINELSDSVKIISNFFIICIYIIQSPFYIITS